MALRKDKSRGDNHFILSMRFNTERSEIEKTVVEHLMKWQDESEATNGSSSDPFLPVLIMMTRTVMNMGDTPRIGEPIDALRHEFEAKMNELVSMLDLSFQHVDVQFDELSERLGNTRIVTGTMPDEPEPEPDNDFDDDYLMSVMMDIEGD